MHQYIQLLRYVAKEIKSCCTKGEVKYVTNKIISQLRLLDVFNKDVLDFVVSVVPLEQQRPYTHSDVVHLNKGVRVYYAVSFK